MWEWIAANATVLVIASSIVALVLLIFNQRLRKFLAPSGEGKLQVKLHTIVNWLYWIIELAVVAFLITSFIALVGGISLDGVNEWLLQHGPKVLITIVVTCILWMVARQLIPALVDRIMARPQRGESREGRQRRAQTLKGVFLGLTRAFVVIVAFFIILSEMGIEIGPLLAGLGIAGVAVGFGAQYLVKDLIAGIFVLMENQYRVGDVASVAGVTGTVEEVNLRKTVLRDLDGAVHHIPNGEIRVASNYSRHFARVNLDISVAYDTDLDYAINVINDVCLKMAQEEGWKPLFRTVPQVLRVNKLGDSGIDIKVTGEVKPLEQWRIMGEMRKRIKTAFDQAGIEIPWPHRKVYFGNMPGDETPKKG